MIEWGTSQSIGAMALGVIFVACGSWVLLDRAGRVARFARWDRKRWLGQHWKTGVYPSPLGYRLFIGGMALSAGCVLTSAGLDHLTGGVASGFFVAIEVLGALGFAASLIASGVVASVARRRDRKA
jgi:hypothetical protein